MPEIGPRAPARTLVAVRATVPVTHMPPKITETMLATPWAPSSQLERWRRPVMPSATTADNSDSIAPNSAMAKASGRIACSFPRLNVGSDGAGSERGMAPNWEEMVATSRWRPMATAEAATTAMRNDGQAGRKRLTTRMTAADNIAIATVAQLSVGRAAQMALNLGSSSEGSCAIVSPSRSLIWLAAMITAMPAVNPTVTGNGMYLM